MSCPLLGLVGASGSGKTTLARRLAEDHGFVRFHMGRPLKDMLKALGLSEADVAGTPEQRARPQLLLGGKSARHASQCATSCYMCVQQYQNRRYHPLLDWRLGLAYLRVISEPKFTCGLDGDFEGYPELKGWPQKAKELSDSVASMRPGSWRSATVGRLDLPYLLEISPSGAVMRRLIVIHPLWRADLDLLATVADPPDEIETRFIDTFDLERRPLRGLELAFDRQDAPPVQLEAAGQPAYDPCP
jgi:hypothetical protein